MALPTKPDMTYVWASGGAKVAPGNTKIQTGWTAEVPPFQWENWSQNRQDAFLDHINKSGFPVWDGLTNYEAAGQSLTKGSDGLIYKSVAASGPSTTVQDPVTDASDVYWTVAFASVGAFLTQAGGDARYTQRANNLSDVTNAATARTNLGVTNAVEGGLQNSFTNLKVSATGTNAGVSITADSVCVKNSSQQQKVLANVSVGPSFALAGANGLDVGAANSQTASTWYFVYVIWNGTTSAGLLSLSSTAPTLPSGYTHFARVSSLRTDGTANKFPFRFFQGGRTVRYGVAAGSNITSPFQIASGSTGGITTFTSISLVNYVPSTAVEATVSVRAAGVASTAILAPSSGYTSANAPLVASTSGGGALVAPNGNLFLETLAVFYASDTAGTIANIYGYTEGL